MIGIMVYVCFLWFKFLLSETTSKMCEECRSSSGHKHVKLYTDKPTPDQSV